MSYNCVFCNNKLEVLTERNATIAFPLNSGAGKIKRYKCNCCNETFEYVLTKSGDVATILRYLEG